MQNNLLSLNYHGNNVRVVMINDNPHWVVADVCKVLGLSKPENVITRINKKYIGSTRLSGTLYNVVSEPGLYELIFRSDKPDAQLFRDWVFETVLPSIRKTGTYTINQEIPSYQIDDEELRAIQWIKERKEYYKQLEFTNQRLLAAQVVLQEQKPYVDMVNDLVLSDGLYSWKDAGSLVGYGRTTLLDLLRANHILPLNSTVPYQRYLDAGYFEVRLLRINGIIHNGTQTFVTKKGIVWLKKLVTKYKKDMESRLDKPNTTNPGVPYYEIPQDELPRRKTVDNTIISIDEFISELPINGTENRRV